MTEAEWLELAGELQHRWPHSTLTDESLAVWFLDLQDLPAQQVTTAIRALYRDGREWPPNGAQIRAKVIELREPTVDHGEAWALVCKARERWGRYGGEGGQVGDEKPLSWIEERSPEAALAARRFGWGELCSYDVAQEQTVRAQYREMFKAIADRSAKTARYAGLPTAGLRALEEGPKRLGAVVKEITDGS